MRENRTLRLTWWELETWPWGNCEPTEQSKDLDWKPSTYSARASSRPYREGGHAMPSGLTVPTSLKDRIRLWKEGVRDVVMELCYALHNFRVRLTPWQPMV